MVNQLQLFNLDDYIQQDTQPFRKQLLKWIGNKQRFAHEIISYFPTQFNTYYEPFVGSGAILGTLAPKQAVASDILAPLIEIWQTLTTNPELLKIWYQERWEQLSTTDKKKAYENIKASFNSQHNGADLLFLSRTCYGGVIRFRKDGYMSTPCGIHDPMHPDKFSERVDIWYERLRNTQFICADYTTILPKAKAGDLIYCDPPYSDTQSILYGAQQFSLDHLLELIHDCKKRGVYVALSIDGTKKNGRRQTALTFPQGLFEHEAVVNCGRSMLRRFQMEGESLEEEVVTDKLLLTY